MTTAAWPTTLLERERAVILDLQRTLRDLQQGRVGARAVLTLLGESSHWVRLGGVERLEVRQGRDDLWRALRARPDLVAVAAAARTRLLTASGGDEPRPPRPLEVDLLAYAHWGFLNAASQLAPPQRSARRHANRWALTHGVDHRQAQRAVRAALPGWAADINAAGDALLGRSDTIRLLHLSTPGVSGVPEVFPQASPRSIALRHLLSDVVPDPEDRLAVVATPSGADLQVVAPAVWAQLVCGPVRGFTVTDGGPATLEDTTRHATALRLFDRGLSRLPYSTCLELADAVNAPAGAPDPPR